MKHDMDPFTRIEVLVVKIASTIVFIALVYWATAWEIGHLLGR
jgi:hypothetical protein